VKAAAWYYLKGDAYMLQIISGLGQTLVEQLYVPLYQQRLRQISRATEGCCDSSKAKTQQLISAGFLVAFLLVVMSHRTWLRIVGTYGTRGQVATLLRPIQFLVLASFCDDETQISSHKTAA